jgi:hypothetical protein
MKLWGPRFGGMAKAPKRAMGKVMEEKYAPHINEAQLI